MKSLTVIVLLSLAALALAQPPDTLWTRTYGGSNREIAFSVKQTTVGGYIVAGVTTSFGACSEDFYLVKTNSQGDTLWTRTYGGSLDDGAYSIQQTTDEGYIVAGSTLSFGAGGYDFYLVKTNSQGDTVWTRTYGGSSYDGANSVQQTLDGGYIVAGVTNSFGVVWYDFYLVKTNSQGDTLWTRTYGGADYDGVYSVQQTTYEGYIVAGWTYSFGAGAPSYSDMYLVKTDSLGDTLWTRAYGTYGGIYDEEARSVKQTTDGGYIVAGTTSFMFTASFDFYLVKTNSQGDTLWTCTYGGQDWDFARSIQRTTDGGYIVAGATSSFGAGGEDFYLVKLGAESSVEPISLSLPQHYSLHPNYPNPFNPSTRITYDLPSPSSVTLEIFDLLGRRVASLAKGTQPAGTYSILFDGSAFPSGLYFYRLQAGAFTQTQKMVLLK